MTGTLADLVQLLPVAFVCGTAVLAATARILPGVVSRNSVFLLTMILCLVPAPELSVAQYVRSVTGDPSVPSLVLLLVAAGSLLLERQLLSNGERHWFAACFATLAILLYPMALGLTAFDPYSLGYAPRLLGAVIGAVALAAIFRARPVIATALLVALAAFSLRLFESPNLWDYLIDPGLAVYTLIVGIREIARAALSRFHGTTGKEPSP